MWNWVQSLKTVSSVSFGKTPKWKQVFFKMWLSYSFKFLIIINWFSTFTINAKRQKNISCFKMSGPSVYIWPQKWCHVLEILICHKIKCNILPKPCIIKLSWTSNSYDSQNLKYIFVYHNSQKWQTVLVHRLLLTAVTFCFNYMQSSYAYVQILVLENHWA